ncbi:PEP-CTERM sorting domain-containing protein [Stieleria sp. ICT_E10.1]|uniref:PEP-CTERM sorting domain-containing protein n=1 Tax=Stieleria sedimenti TaxID=2976331 RepID=UPI00217FC10A|nr:PEP-CTERM sorting domain-containing protein [Stieleria sedimenti]MCS7469111.1 PEP-CTERM sorting domain-containing protein [Stieleria sedimenti]
MSCFRLMVCLLLAALVSTPASAGVMSLTLDSRGVDLNGLEVGNSVTIDVLLDRMGVGKLLDLGTTVTLSSSSHLSDPAVSPVAGVIIPDPFDVFFLGGSANEFVDAQFSTILSIAFEPEINSDGVFFSFDLTAVAAGSGSIGFGPYSPFAISANNPLNPIFDIDTNALNYTVTSSNAVPEPSSFMIFGCFGVAGLMRRRSKVSDSV